jgi:hypothetical protein
MLVLEGSLKGSKELGYFNSPLPIPELPIEMNTHFDEPNSPIEPIVRQEKRKSTEETTKKIKRRK